MARQWEGQSRGGRTGNLIFLRLIEHCGLGAAYVLLSLVVVYFIPFSPKGTRSVWVYARKILGYRPLKAAFFVYKNYFAFGQSLIDRAAMSIGMHGKFKLVFDTPCPLADYIDNAVPCIGISAHVGNWSCGVPYFGNRKSRINFVMYDNENAKVKEAKAEHNADESSMIKMIPVNRDSLSHIFMITEAIDRNECVFFLGDRYLSEEKVLTTGFMGRQAKFPKGVFVLASKMKADIVFSFFMRERHREYHCSFFNVSPEEYSGQRHPEQYILERYSHALEGIMKKYPEQWYNYFDFWNIYTN